MAPPSFRARLRETWHRWRNNLVAQPAVRERLAAFPLTRPVARRQARALFDLCAGFVYSQILAACLRVGLFEHLRDGPMAVAALARRTGLDVEALARLVDGAAALGLLERHSGDRISLGLLGAALIDNPGIEQMVRHHAMLYADLADPVALLRGEHAATQLGAFWSYAGAAEPASLGEDQVSPYSDLMAVSQSLVAQEILNAYDLSTHLCLLDVGGGDGSFLRAVAARHPRLQLQLFDLPAVAELAQARCADAGLTQRLQVFGGSFHTDALPTGADVISLVRVIHDHDDEEALAILRRVHAALPPAGGTLLLAEPMAATPGAETVGDAYFGFYLLAMGKGRPRSVERLRALLETAGFRRVRLRQTHLPLQTRVLTAQSVKLS